MKAFALFCFFFSVIFAGIWFNWWYPATYEASLILSDDASLPEAKAKYLKEYLLAVDNISGPPAFIFMRKDLELSRQKEILQGLIQRFEDISKIPPSEMAYQQGMQQLSGQEMEHQLDRISGIFESAKLRENPLVFFIIVWGWVVYLAIFFIFLGVDEMRLFS